MPTRGARRKAAKQHVAKIPRGAEAQKETQEGGLGVDREEWGERSRLRTGPRRRGE